MLENNEENLAPSREEMVKILEQAIEECIVVLEKKLSLLNQNDNSTLVAFKKWFGYIDESRKQVIEPDRALHNADSFAYFIIL